jgi:hypothetical protein
VKVERDPDAPATVADIEVDEKEQLEEMRILIRVRSAPCISCREADVQYGVIHDSSTSVLDR